MSLQRKARPVLRSVVLFTLLVLACRSDSTTGPGAAPEISPSPNLAALACTANISTRTVRCASPSDPLNRGTSLSFNIDPGAANPSYAIFGGNHTNVEVTTSNIVNDIPNHHFSFDLNIKNLSIVPIGTTDGISSDGSLSIFFHQGPTATGGTGIVTVANPTGLGTFTAAQQPYFNYGEMLAQNETSASKNWVLDYTPTVTTFDFVLLISASLEHPDGFIDIYPKTGIVVIPGGTFQLADTVRNGLGAVNSLQKVEWSSSDPSTVTVDTLGLVKGIKLGSATITATQSLKIGSIVVQVLPPTPPTAVNDTTRSNSEPGDDLHTAFNAEFGLPAPGLLANDNRGAPFAFVTSFGGGDIPGIFPVGDEVSPLPGHTDGSLQVNADGSVIFIPPTDFTGYLQTSYHIANGIGSGSNATLRLAVGERPSVFDVDYLPQLLVNVGINTSISTHTKVGATGDALKYNFVSDSLGAASIHLDGTFEFLPDVAQSGDASFQYTAENGFGTTGPAQVKLKIVGPRLWFVDINAASNGNGQFGTPFTCISGASCYANVAAFGDIIHVRHGVYTNPSFFVVSPNSRLIAEGASGAFSDPANANVTWPADAGPQPATGGARPTINAVTSNAVIAGSNTIIRGVVFGSAPLASLVNSGQSVTISDAAILNSVGTAISLDGTGPVNISVDSIKSGPAAATTPIFISNRSGTLNSAVTKIIVTTNQAVGISGGSISVNLGTGLIQSPDGEAVIIVKSQANFSFAGTVSNSYMPLSMNGINVSCGNVTFTGTVQSTTRGIDVRNCLTGSVSFSGPVTLSTGTFPAISILNSATPVQFTGGSLSATTTTANTVVAQNAVLSVTGASNTLSSAGGTALSLTNVSTSGLTFRSISANGGANGIVLKNMSGTGGLTVTGVAGGICGGIAKTAGGFLPPAVADCTGGTIQGMTGAFPAGVGIYLENAKNITLGSLRVRGNANFGTYGDSVAGLTMDRDYFSNNGLSAAGEGTGNIYLYGLIGTASINNSFSDSGAVANVFVRDTIGTLSLSMNGTMIGNDGASTGKRGVFIHAVNSNVNASILNGRFFGSREIGAHMLVNGLSTADFVFTGNVMTNNHPSVTAGHRAVVVEGSGTAGATKPVVTYDISSNVINNNTSANQSGDAIFVFKDNADNGHFRGTISANAIGNGSSKSGSALGDGIRIVMIASGADTVNILNNNIKNTAIDGIGISNQAPTNTGSLVATITGNNVNTPEATSLNPISFLLGPPSSSGKNCLTIGGAGALANIFAYSSILLSVRTTTPVGLPGLVGDPAAYLAARNNGATSTLSLSPGASLSGTCP